MSVRFSLSPLAGSSPLDVHESRSPLAGLDSAFDGAGASTFETVLGQQPYPFQGELFTNDPLLILPIQQMEVLGQTDRVVFMTAEDILLTRPKLEAYPACLTDHKVCRIAADIKLMVAGAFRDPDSGSHGQR